MLINPPIYLPARVILY